MNVNIYYGGRGLIEDPTIYVMNKVAEILTELRVNVQKYNLYERRSNISTLPKTLKEADGVILAVHPEWLGIGGLMQQFLDACWLYADKGHMSKLYMMPIVISSAYGERDAECTLIKAWELLGGIPVDGFCAYSDNQASFETNASVLARIEKRAESFYRDVNQKSTAMPNSYNEVRKKVIKTKAIDLTPQESEQLSEYVSNDQYVKKQKEDIEELALKFKGMLGEKIEEEDKIIPAFRKCFKNPENITASYRMHFEDTDQFLLLRIAGEQLDCRYSGESRCDVYINTKSAVIEQIILGNKTFQGSFMSGEITAKGNFKILRMLDTLFIFK